MHYAADKRKNLTNISRKQPAYRVTAYLHTCVHPTARTQIRMMNRNARIASQLTGNFDPHAILATSRIAPVRSQTPSL